MASLLAEALLIRKQFNYNIISKSDFDSNWDTIENSHQEVGRNDWKYTVNGLVDTPRYVDQAWHDYLTGDRPHMPVISTNQMPPICYEGFRDVVLIDGSTAKVFGEICYENGQYIFSL